MNAKKNTKSAETQHIARKINGKWHIIQPDGTPIRNGFHQPIAFTHYWSVDAFCHTYQIHYRFENAS